MTTTSDDLTARMKIIAPGYYTERDGGYWYVLTPDHDRIGEEFQHRDNARRFVCWLAGDPLPKGWQIERRGDGRVSYDVVIPGQYSAATLWARPCRDRFPAMAPLFPHVVK